jgi:hypothetical protein
MIRDEDSKSTSGNKLSSSQIRQNFMQPKKERYIGLKVAAVIALLLLIWFIYSVATAPSVPTSVNPIDSTSNQVFEPKDTVVKKPANSNKKIRVRGSDKEDLRKKLLSVSEKLMQNMEYAPINAQLNIRSLQFSCELEKRPSSFIKLSFVYGPKMVGCEACDNVLSKNPGSVVISRGQDSEYIYNVIAVAN